MGRFNADVVQNVEVSKKYPCEKPLYEQLEIMQLYTDAHRHNQNASAAIREVECLKVLYPRLFRRIEISDKFAGRIDFLPVGFGCVTSLGGVGHYCVFSKLRTFQMELEDEEDKKSVDELYLYWLENDVKAKYCKDVLTDDVMGTFVDCNYPLIATARLSGMMLDYQKLMELGIDGLEKEIQSMFDQHPENEFYHSSLRCLDLFRNCTDALCDQILLQMENETDQRKKELLKIEAGLKHIRHHKPETFHEALQLFWLFALLSGVINYGRLDDVLGPYLARDLEKGILTEDEALDYFKSLWTMIENRRTTVNGRIIVGGRGRKNPAAADVFVRFALRTAKELRYVEPQFTLRVDEDTPAWIWDMAMDALESGATYPTIYNDTVNIPALQYAMRVDEKAAEQYVPFGCTEFVLQGQSTGTPNVCMNVLKLLTIFVNEGMDPEDGKCKSGSVPIRPLSEYTTFDLFYDDFKKLIDYYMDRSIEAQIHSYQVMNQEVCYLFSSILTNDCISRGKTLLDGGVRYLGGTDEIYGLINTSDALWAIRDLVFEQKKYSLLELQHAARVNFEGFEMLRRDLWECDKYGNDLDTADQMALDIYHHIAKGIRQRGIDYQMQYFLIVISNNQLNTEWGRTTGASLDGRFRGMYMNPANNPQGGANIKGPTAMLNSLAKFEAKYHGGSVQNIKFSPAFFKENRQHILTLFKTYFKKGGSHIMVTVVGRGILEDAVKYPEKYPDLIVRVSGFSAVFINLDADIQQELMSRVLYD